jgi:heat shock transcription factor
MSGQNDDENEQELEKKVALAKRDAQGKRKQIPPFVQKLSRYVSRGDLIFEGPY